MGKGLQYARKGDSGVYCRVYDKPIREGNASWGREIDFFALLEGKSQVEGQLAMETPSTAPKPMTPDSEDVAQ